MSDLGLDGFPEGLVQLWVFGAILCFVVAAGIFAGPRALSFLIVRYLRKRRIAWVSLIAVMLCTTMVLVVISVMGGWIRMFRESFHNIGGDVIVRAESIEGFPHYQEMIRQITALPEVKAAAPVLRSFALINVNDQIRKGVEVIGYPPNISDVNGFQSSLYRLNGNLEGVLLDEECGRQAAQQKDPLAAARQTQCPHGHAAAQYGLVTPDGFLQFDDQGDEIARLYLEKNEVRHVKLRGEEIRNIYAVTEISANKGNHSGYLVDLFCANDLLYEKDIKKAAANLICPHDRSDAEFGLVSGKNVLRFDDRGNQLAHDYLKTAGASAPYVSVSANEIRNVYRIESVAPVSGPLNFDLWPHGRYLPPPKYASPRPVTDWDGMIVGLGVLGIGKDPDGEIRRPSLMYRVPVSLTVLPINPDSSLIDVKERTTQVYWIIDDSRTKVHLYDANTVYVPFETLQRDLVMEGTDPEKDPARTTEIQIALKPDADLAVAKQKITKIADAIAKEKGFYDDLMPRYAVKTWEETHATFLGAVEKEKLLVTLLFAIISVVAIFLIFCIFYMIVVEKTRDIGIIKSVGATSTGVAGIFLGYGMAIGIVGGGLGLLLGYLIVHNINWLHDSLARLTGQYMWSPETYLFDTIPNTMNATEVTIIVAVAIVSSVLGALVPAVRAARMHPVEALRWE